MAKQPVVMSDEDALMEDLEDTSSNILQTASPPPPKSGKPTPRIDMPGRKGIKTLKILLEENADIPPTGQFIGHNGTTYLLRPGIWVEVPLPIIEILDNAVQQVPQRDPVTNQITGWREKLRYPYRVAPGASRAAA